MGVNLLLTDDRFDAGPELGDPLLPRLFRGEERDVEPLPQKPERLHDSLRVLLLRGDGERVHQHLHAARHVSGDFVQPPPDLGFPVHHDHGFFSFSASVGMAFQRHFFSCFSMYHSAWPDSTEEFSQAECVATPVMTATRIVKSPIRKTTIGIASSLLLLIVPPTKS